MRLLRRSSGQAGWSVEQGEGRSRELGHRTHHLAEAARSINPRLWSENVRAQCGTTP